MVEQQFEQSKQEIIPKPSLEKEPQEGKVEIEKELSAIEKETAQEQSRVKPLPTTSTSPQPVRIPKTETRKKIERILSENLIDIYKAMDENQKLAFRKKGEETAQAIEKLIQSAKATAKKIIELIREWLKIIPGINKFFLEQETKIKADKILELIKKK